MFINPDYFYIGGDSSRYIINVFLSSAHVSFFRSTEQEARIDDERHRGSATIHASREQEPKDGPQIQKNYIPRTIPTNKSSKTLHF